MASGEGAEGSLGATGVRTRGGPAGRRRLYVVGLIGRGGAIGTPDPLRPRRISMFHVATAFLAT